MKQVGKEKEKVTKNRVECGEVKRRGGKGGLSQDNMGQVWVSNS